MHAVNAPLAAEAGRRRTVETVSGIRPFRITFSEISCEGMESDEERQAPLLKTSEEHLNWKKRG